MPIQKKYMHLTFGVDYSGVVPIGDEVTVSLNGRRVVRYLVKDGAVELDRIRKMNKHRFMRWLQTRPGYHGIDLTQRAI